MCRAVAKVGTHSPSIRWVSQPEMVLVQMCVHDGVDVGRRKTGIVEPLEPWQVQIVPERQRSLLAVADTRVDQNGAPAQLDDERLDAEGDGAVGPGGAGVEPVDAADIVRSCCREERLHGDARRLRLDQRGDRRPANDPSSCLGAHRPRRYQWRRYASRRLPSRIAEAFMALPIADRWFERRRIDDSITLLWEPHVVELMRCNIWHVRGRDRDLVIDTGMGVMSLSTSWRTCSTAR